MDWIRIDTGAPDHPKVRRLARKLAIPVAVAVGHLVTFWAWCGRQREDGWLGDLEAEDIADAAGWTGDAEAFVAALRAAGLIDDAENGAELHDWLAYQGKNARAAALHALRQAKYKASRSAAAASPDSQRSVTSSSAESHDGTGRDIDETKDRNKRATARSSADADAPGWQSLIDRMTQSWESKYGKKLAWAKKDFGLLKEKARDLGAEEVARRWAIYLADDDPFYRGHEVSKFCSGVNRWATAGAARPGSRSRSNPGLGSDDLKHYSALEATP